MPTNERIPFYMEELSRTAEVRGANELQHAYDILSDVEAKPGFIDSGNVTLAMIRPQVGPEANLLGYDDATAAQVIEDMIEELAVMAKFSVALDTESVERFYEGGPEEAMLQQDPVDPGTYSTRWPEFIDFMTSGPTTVLLLYSQSGDAIERWRSHLGHWNVDLGRDESTIRGRLAVNKYNNLVHGSDSPQAVRREIGIIKDAIRRG